MRFFLLRDPSEEQFLTVGTMQKPRKMCQTLPKPIKTKQSGRVYNNSISVGYSSMQGWRVSMEDAHRVLLPIPEDPNASFFAVFDGHGGASIANYASEHLAEIIVKQEVYTKGNIVEAIKKGFLELDSIMKANELLRAELSGSTAVTVLLKDNKVFCGNAGDSRAIAMIGDNVRALSQDHNPSVKTENDRIIEAGGFVHLNRVNGTLALSRALGDYSYKSKVKSPAENQIVTANPDVTVMDLSTQWKFIVLACDGIWNVLTNEEVASFVDERLAINVDPQLICEQLLDRCLAPEDHMGHPGTDNMSVIIVEFSNEDNAKPGPSERT